MSAPDDKCDLDSCGPSHLRRGLQPFHATIALACIPFIFTFFVVAFIAWRKLFPVLSGRTPNSNDALNTSKIPTISLRRASTTLKSFTYFSVDKAAAFTFSATIALSAVLAELIFCEISNILNPAARSFALELTISILLFSLVIATPAIEIHAITTAAGWKFNKIGRWNVLLALLLDILGLVGWLAAFWWIGEAFLGSQRMSSDDLRTHSFSEGSLERIGVIGISLMASLAGFAAVSSLWQTFGVKVRKVTEADLTRKQAGLQATTDLLAAKESRLRALEKKMGAAPEESFFGRIIGSLRGDSDTEELSTLKLEISGLETMQLSLSNSLSLLRSRYDAQRHASTAMGRLWLTASYVFSLYCLYRILATSLATLRRWWSPATTFASTDPINNVLAIIAKNWDPSLDREAWSRQISFLLSGLMLLASFNAVLQTVLLFSRFTPTRLLHSAQRNLALLVSQISATYVVSSALLLRSNLPKEMGSVIEGALGAPLDTVFVERWFEGWFLTACAVTAAAIWVSRTFSGNSLDWEDDLTGDGGDVEAGKKH